MPQDFSGFQNFLPPQGLFGGFRSTFDALKSSRSTGSEGSMELPMPSIPAARRRRRHSPACFGSRRRKVIRRVQSRSSCSFSAGGPTDTIARILGERMAGVLDNRSSSKTSAARMARSVGRAARAAAELHDQHRAREHACHQRGDHPLQFDVLNDCARAGSKQPRN